MISAEVVHGSETVLWVFLHVLLLDLSTLLDVRKMWYYAFYSSLGPNAVLEGIKGNIVV